MAPSSGHCLVPKAIKFVKFALSKTTSLIRSKLPKPAVSTTETLTLQPIRLTNSAHPIHPLARLRQSRSQHRSFSTTPFNPTSKPKHPSRSSLPYSQTSKAIVRRGSAPFASTLRPNLTGGALPRSAGGYSLGGSGRGVRHFSHTPTAQAQVVQNVSAGLRAFVLGGGKARYDGLDGRTGEKKWRAVSKTEDEVVRNLDKMSKVSMNKGTKLEFRLTPTITALSSSSFSSTQTLHTPSLLTNLTTDLSHALKDLSTTLQDLQRLSSLGDLPLSLSPNRSSLVVHFPGTDAQTVSNLCDEVGICRGVVREDEGWVGDRAVEMALLFPFAESEVGIERTEVEGVDWREMMMMGHSRDGNGRVEMSAATDENCTSAVGRGVVVGIGAGGTTTEGYESLRGSDFEYGDFGAGVEESVGVGGSGGDDRAALGGKGEYEGVEGFLRFLRECEGGRG